MSQEYYLGVDIGGTKILAVLLTTSGLCVGQIQEPTLTAGGEALADQVLAIATGLMAQQKRNVRELKGIGIGIPASVDPNSNSLSHIPNIADMEGTRFYTQLASRFACPVYMENDVNTAAFAEYSAAPKDPLAFIAIGTGIGMGLIGDGRLLRGHLGAAGEIAYLPLGGKVGFGRATLEERLGGDGWREAYKAAGGHAKAELAELFVRPDPIFTAVLQEQVELLCHAMLAVWSVIAPQSFVLGGSIGTQELLVETLNSKILNYIPTSIEIRASQFGQNAGAVGAGMLCAKRIGRI